MPTTTPLSLSLPSYSPSINEIMRGRKMDRFVILPFSAGCASQSSVAVVDNQPKKAQEEPTLPPPSGEKQRNSVGLLAKLIKSLKSLSQVLVVYEEYEEEEVEVEMEIGFPTDVQHVGHIGWDGFNNVSSMKSWNDGAPHEFFLPSVHQN